MQFISAQEFIEKRNADPDLHVLDVRSIDEIMEVRLAGHVYYIPLSDLERKIDMLTPAKEAKAPVYVLCRTSVRSRTAAEYLAKNGYPQAIVVEGGMISLVDLGAEIVSG